MDTTWSGGTKEAAVRRPDYRFIARWTWFGLVAAGALYIASTAPWNAEWSGRDLSRYLEADYATGLLYSPAFAALVAPLRALPFPLVVALWRVAEVAALVLAVRGTTLSWAVFLIPGLWWSELVTCNVMGFGTAAMIAVLRWPSVRNVTLYAVMVALIPKPSFLPVLAWAFVTVPTARRWVILAGIGGLLMLAWPGYLNAILTVNEGHLANFRWVQPWGYLAAGILTLIGLRFPRLLGVAALVATPYVFPYSSVVVGASLTAREPLTPPYRAA